MFWAMKLAVLVVVAISKEYRGDEVPIPTRPLKLEVAVTVRLVIVVVEKLDPEDPVPKEIDPFVELIPLFVRNSELVPI